MPARDRKKTLLENLIRLRRAAHAAPHNRDLAAVRFALEDELGASVSQRLAASVLGVSHTALGRWVRSGDVPTVYSPGGRSEIPVSALLDLYEAVEREREAGRRKRHVIEPAMLDARRRARDLNRDDLVAPSDSGEGGHRRAERFGLAYHRVLAKSLRRAMVDEARQTLWRWREQEKIDHRYAEQWETLLSRPILEIRRVLAQDSAWACDLRQSSPFAGMLSEPERRRILEEVR